MGECSATPGCAIAHRVARVPSPLRQIERTCQAQPSHHAISHTSVGTLSKGREEIESRALHKVRRLGVAALGEQVMEMPVLVSRPERGRGPCACQSQLLCGSPGRPKKRTAARPLLSPEATRIGRAFPPVREACAVSPRRSCGRRRDSTRGPANPRRAAARAPAASYPPARGG